MVVQSVSVSCEPCAYGIHIITVETVGILVGRRLLQRAEVELGAAHDDQLEPRGQQQLECFTVHHLVDDAVRKAGRGGARASSVARAAAQGRTRTVAARQDR